MESIKKPTAEANQKMGLSKTVADKSSKKPCIRKDSKQFKVLQALASGKSFNRFEAERELHDHCLHSTVSTIQGLGIQVYRQRETVPCLGGKKKTDVMRYRLLQPEIKKAEKLLGVAA